MVRRIGGNTKVRAHCRGLITVWGRPPAWHCLRTVLLVHCRASCTSHLHVACAGMLWRHAVGMAQVLREELTKVCEGAEVIEKVAQIEIVGNYRKPVRDYLLGLGF